MIKIIIKSSDSLVESHSTADPVEAESLYFRLSRLRFDRPAGLLVTPMTMRDIVPPAHFRLDADWPNGPDREKQPERTGLWATDAREFEQPTVFQIRGLAAAIELTGEEIARRLGINGRQWRYYLQDGPAHQDIPFPVWATVRGWLK